MDGGCRNRCGEHDKSKTARIQQSDKASMADGSSTKSLAQKSTCRCGRFGKLYKVSFEKELRNVEHNFVLDSDTNRFCSVSAQSSSSLMDIDLARIRTDVITRHEVALDSSLADEIDDLGDLDRDLSQAEDAKRELAVNFLLALQQHEPSTPAPGRFTLISSETPTGEHVGLPPQEYIPHPAWRLPFEGLISAPTLAPISKEPAVSLEGQRIVPIHQISKESTASKILRRTFPTKLFRALVDARSQGLHAVCSFMPSGKTFRIHDSNRFMKEIAQKYFRQTKYASFLRQLQMYDFVRVVEANVSDCYAHEYFQESHPELLPNILRKQSIEPRGRRTER